MGDAEIIKGRSSEELDRLVATHRDETKAAADKVAAVQQERQQQRDATLDPNGIDV
jgi:hypothetical protein